MFGQRLRYYDSGSYCYSGSNLLANTAFGQHGKYCYSEEYCYNGDCYSGALLYVKRRRTTTITTTTVKLVERDARVKNIET